MSNELCPNKGLKNKLNNFSFLQHTKNRYAAKQAN